MKATAAPFSAVEQVRDQQTVRRCFDLMHKLRQNLSSADDFVGYWERQRRRGYRLAAQFQGEVPVILAGFRIRENLVHGRYLYVDDLIADSAVRNQGGGTIMMQHLIATANAKRCTKILLDTPVSNVGAQRFYYRQGLTITAFRFGAPLETPGA